MEEVVERLEKIEKLVADVRKLCEKYHTKVLRLLLNEEEPDEC